MKGVKYFYATKILDIFKEKKIATFIAVKSNIETVI